MSSPDNDKPTASKEKNSGNDPAKQNVAVSAQTGSKTENGSQQKAPANEAVVQKEAIKADASTTQGKKELTNTERQPTQTAPTAPAGKFVLFPQRPVTPPQSIAKVAAGTAQNQTLPQQQAPAAAPVPAQRRRPKAKTQAQQRRYQRRKMRKRNAPRRPMTSYMAFVKDHYKRLDLRNGRKASLYGAELGRAWRSLTTEQKNPYVHRAIADRARWEREKQQYAVRIGPKRPRSAYAWFVKDTYPRLPKVPNKGARYYGNELGRRWRQLGMHERGRFQQLARDDLLRYIREKTAWMRRGGDRRLF